MQHLFYRKQGKNDIRSSVDKKNILLGVIQMQMLHCKWISVIIKIISTLLLL